MTGRFAWPEGKRMAVLFNVAYEAWSEGTAPGGSPMGNPLPPGVMDTQGISWGSYGHKEGIWRLLRILDAHEVSATVFASGCIAERAPDTIRALASSGHEIAAHSYTQDLLPALLDEQAERENIERCTQLLGDLIDGHISGWLSPRCTPSPRTGSLLVEAGYAWNGDCFDRDHPYLESHPAGDLVAIPFTMDVNDLPHYLRHGNTPGSLLEVFTGTLDQLYQREDNPGHLDVTVHAHVFGRPYGAWVLERMIEITTEHDDIWVPTRAELAAWTRQVFDPNQ